MKRIFVSFTANLAIVTVFLFALLYILGAWGSACPRDGETLFLCLLLMMSTAAAFGLFLLARKCIHGPLSLEWHVTAAVLSATLLAGMSVTLVGNAHAARCARLRSVRAADTKNFSGPGVARLVGFRAAWGSAAPIDSAAACFVPLTRGHSRDPVLWLAVDGCIARADELDALIGTDTLTVAPLSPRDREILRATIGDVPGAMPVRCAGNERQTILPLGFFLVAGLANVLLALPKKWPSRRKMVYCLCRRKRTK